MNFSIVRFSKKDDKLSEITVIYFSIVQFSKKLNGSTIMSFSKGRFSKNSTVIAGNKKIRNYGHFLLTFLYFL